jgi:HEAT repeat protein
MDASAPAQMKSAVDAAIAAIDATGRAAKMSPAELYLAGGENYYAKKASYLPQLANEKTNPVWLFDKNLNNVTPVAVPTEIWNYVMALRMAEATLKADPNNAGAVSLWLAANLQRELRLPAGVTDPSKLPTAQDADFYAKAAGPVYMNPVLARALDDHDSALALRAVTALEATGGVSGLVANADSPLVRALSHPDRAVRFKAAFALARANPLSQFPSFFRVVPILCEAISSSATPSVLLVVADDTMRNAVTDALRSSDVHYTVYAGNTISTALQQAQRAPAFDVVIMPDSADVSRIAEMGRTDYRLTGVPVLVTAKADDLTNVKNKYSQGKGYVAIDVASDAETITAALNKARADMGVTPLSPEALDAMSMTALHLLDTLAADHRSIYNIGEATTTLVDALKDKRPEVVTTAAAVIGKLNNPEAQRALAAVALSDGETALRATFFHCLAESAKRTGNALDGAQVSALIKVVTTGDDVKLRTAAAEALGALNVPSNQASTLIRQQTR